MKRTYIKPEMEELDTELSFILCASGKTGGDVKFDEDEGEGGEIIPTDPGTGGPV